MASTYELIETTTLSSAASSVTFSSITQDYRDLVLVVAGSAAGFTKVQLNFNNDTGLNYFLVQMRGSGSSASSESRTDSKIASGGVQDFSTNQGIVIDQILDYSATDKHKTVLRRSNNTDQIGVMAVAGRWADTSAITEIDVSGTQDYAIGTTFSLYGIAA